MIFMQREKLVKCYRLFCFYTNPKSKCIVNLYQNVLLGNFSEDIKMWPSHNVLNW